MRRPAMATGVSFAFGVALVAPAAWAQAISLPSFNEPLGGPDQRSELPERSTMSRGSVAIFDYEHTFGGAELEGGPMWWRFAGTNPTRGGWELSMAGTTESRLKSVFLGGMIRVMLRGFDQQSYAFTPIQNMAFVGVRLGPFEPEVRLGFSLATLDAFHGQWSFEMLSPRVEGGLGLRFGRLRISAHGFSEYLWRWWGDSTFEKGVAFEVRLESVKKKSPLGP